MDSERRRLVFVGIAFAAGAALIALFVFGDPLGLVFGAIREVAFSGCGMVMAATWTEPGIYETFPPEGRVGDYSISWNEDPDTGERPFKKAEDRNLTNDPVTAKTLVAFETNATSWIIRHDEVLGGRETHELLEATFDELGLAEPEDAPHEYTWRTAC